MSMKNQTKYVDLDYILWNVWEICVCVCVGVVEGVDPGLKVRLVFLSPELHTQPN